MALPKFPSPLQALNYLQTQWAALLDPVIDKVNTLSSAKTPTSQRFMSGSGTYKAPANVSYIRIRMVGGGGGADGTAGGAGGGTGTNTSFGSLICNGGSRITGGSAFLNNQANASGMALSGAGGNAPAGVANTSGGMGGASPFGGSGGGSASGSAGLNASPNSGSGGGGAGGTAGAIGGFGGGAGGYIDAFIITPSNYSYSVGSGGASGSAGGGGFVGGGGGSGMIIVDEFYQ